MAGEFEVPDPVSPGVSAQILASFVGPWRAPTPLEQLRAGAQQLVSWEQLLADGLTAAQLLQCHPRCVAAWVRTASGACATWEGIRLLEGASAFAVLQAWGPLLCPVSARMLRIDRAALDGGGLTAAQAAELAWPDRRWVELFGAAPETPQAAAPAAGRVLPRKRDDERYEQRDMTVPVELTSTQLASLRL